MLMPIVHEIYPPRRGIAWLAAPVAPKPTPPASPPAATR
jgi:hypothetical protein